MAANNLSQAFDTSVKFYASLTRQLAKGEMPLGTNAQGIATYVEPGAICFVSDAQGNSIFLNNRLFGDGAIAGGSSGGGGGITEVNLSDIVVVEKDGSTLKTLADYFDADGKIITDYLIINTTLENSLGQLETVTAVSIDATGITINGSKVITLSDLNTAILNATASITATAQGYANTAEQNAKTYADGLLTGIYKVQGSVLKYDDLSKITNPQLGDVYNVITSQGTIGSSTYIPPGTNYVYIDDGTNAYWDALGGTVDLSNYATGTDVSNAVNGGVTTANGYTDALLVSVKQDIQANQSSINTLSSNYTTLSSSVLSNTTNIATNTTNIETNTTNITNIATQLTWQ